MGHRATDCGCPGPAAVLLDRDLEGMGFPMGKPMGTHRKTIGKWEKHWKTMGKMESDRENGKITGKPWESGGLPAGKVT